VVIEESEREKEMDGNREQGAFMSGHVFNILHMDDGFNQSSRGSTARMLHPHEKRVALHAPQAFMKIRRFR